MNIITLATSCASIKLPDRLASCSLSCGQSDNSAVITGPGEMLPRRIPCLNTWRRTVCTKQSMAHFEDA